MGRNNIFGLRWKAGFDLVGERLWVVGRGILRRFGCVFFFGKVENYKLIVLRYLEYVKD